MAMQRALPFLGGLSALLVACSPLHVAAGGDGGVGAGFLARPATSADVIEVQNATAPGIVSEALENASVPSSEAPLAFEEVATSGDPCDCEASWEYWGARSGCVKTWDSSYPWCRVEESCTSATQGATGAYRKCEVGCNCKASWTHGDLFEKIATYHGCDRTPGTSYSWCYVVGECSSASDWGLAPWRKC
jgi:hypothetical protein